MKHPNIVLFLAEDLDFEFIQTGSLVVCTEEENRPGPESLRLINTKTDRPASDSRH